nr:unnamed protein product [Digitaria exilis]
MRMSPFARFYQAHHNSSSSAPIPLEVDDHPRAGISKGTFTLERAFPSRSRLGKLDLAVQAQAGLTGNDALDSATHYSNRGITAPHHRPRPGEDTGQIHLQQWTSERHAARPRLTWQQHCANHSADFARLGRPSKEATKTRSGRRTQVATLDVVSRHKKEGHHPELEGAIPTRIVCGMGSTVRLATSTPRTHVLAPSPLVYKRGRETQAKGKGQQTQGLRSSSPSPTLLVTPYHEQHVNRCSAPLLDVRPRGRNQDKTPGNEWISTAITCLCRCDQIRHRHAAQPSFPMANFDQGRPPLGESNLLPVGQEIWFGSLRRNQATNWRLLICHWQHRNDGVIPDLAYDERAPPTEGEITRSGPRERAAPFLPGPMSAPRATTARPYPYGLRGPTATYASLVRTAMNRHLASGRDLAALTPDDSRTESEGRYAFEHEHPGLSSLPNSGGLLLRLSDDEYDPTRECFVISDGRISEGSTSDHDGEDNDQGGSDGADPVGAQPPDPSDHSPSEDERHPRRLPRVARPHDLGSGDVSPPARSDHELPKQGHEHSTDARRAGRDDDLAPRTSQKLIAAAALLRAMPEAATSEGRKLHLEAQKLVENAARQQAESSASRLRRSSASKGERGGESLVRSPRPNGRARAQSRGGSHWDMPRRHVGEPRAPEAGTPPARVPARSRLRDTRGAINDGDARNTLNQMRQREGAWSHQRGRTDVGWNWDAAPKPAGTRVFGHNIRTAPIPPRFRQPTTIIKYSGETDPRVWLNDYRLACQLGGATDDDMIIRNLPLHLADSARTWLEHLPPQPDPRLERPGRNLRGEFPGHLRCKQKPGESLRDFIRRFSKRCTELPNITDHQIIHSFLESTTCYSLVCKLGRSPPPDANRLFEVASKYASGEEAANAIFNDKKGKRPEEASAEDDKTKGPSKKRKHGKKGKKLRAPRGAGDVEDEALAVDPNLKGPRGPPRGGGIFDDLLKKPCPYHKTAVAHTLEQCEMLGSFTTASLERMADDDGYPKVEHVFFIMGGPAGNLKPLQRRRERREVLLARPATPSYLDWSSETISFGREDHPDHIPNPGQYPLVVDPVSSSTNGY